MNLSRLLRFQAPINIVLMACILTEISSTPQFKKLSRRRRSLQKKREQSTTVKEMHAVDQAEPVDGHKNRLESTVLPLTLANPSPFSVEEYPDVAGSPSSYSFKAEQSLQSGEKLDFFEKIFY